MSAYNDFVHISSLFLHSEMLPLYWAMLSDILELKNGQKRPKIHLFCLIPAQYKVAKEVVHT